MIEAKWYFCVIKNVRYEKTIVFSCRRVVAVFCDFGIGSNRQLD